MERVNYYIGTRKELIKEIKVAEAIIKSNKPHHEDPLEDLIIRGIWECLLDHLLMQLNAHAVG